VYNNFVNVVQFSLKNGINVFLVPQPEATSVAVELMVNAGSKHEKVSQEGLAHFFEHMAFKGTEKWPSTQKLARYLDGIGAIYNAYTDKEKTAYWVKTAPRFLDSSLEVISQLLNNSLVDPKEIEIEKGVIIEEMNMYEDQPSDWVEDIFEEQVLGKNRLGRSILGRKEVIKAVTKKDFLEFRCSWYYPQRMSIAVVGKIDDLAKTKEKIISFFDGRKGKEKPEPKVKTKLKKEKIFWHKKDTQQTHFLVGLPTFSIMDDRWPELHTVSAVLGRGMSSRLWEIIREKRGWAYYVYSFCREYSQAGFFTVAAGVKNQVAKNALGLVEEEIEKISKNLKQNEVEKAKKMTIGRLMISMEDPTRITSMLNGNWLLRKEIIRPEDIAKKMEQVAFEKVKRLAKEIFIPSKIRAAVIGPKT
jgi:predicted Zn-dependent peptidase